MVALPPPEGGLGVAVARTTAGSTGDGRTREIRACDFYVFEER